MAFEIISCVVALLLGAVPITEPVRQLAGLHRIIRENPGGVRDFDVTTSVVRIPVAGNSLFAGDGVHCVEVYRVPVAGLRTGDVIRIRGKIRPTNIGMQAHVDALTRVAHGEVPPPLRCSAADILSGRHDRDFVAVTGEIVDAYYDDIDPNFSYFTLLSDGHALYVPMQCRPPLERLHSLVGAHVTVAGICQRPTGVRPYLNREICVNGPDDVRIDEAPPADRFAVPDLFASDIPAQTGRRRAQGRVIASWGGNRLLLRTAEGRSVLATTLSDRLPGVDACVDVAGYSDTNAYGKNLIRCIWRNRPDDQPPAPSPKDTSVRELFFNAAGASRIDAANHGKVVRLRGTVCGVSVLDDRDAFALIEDRHVLLRVHACTAQCDFRALPVGSQVEATGVCVIELAAKHDQEPAQHIQNVYLVQRTPDDLRVLAFPPWWTPARLLILVGILLAALAGIFLWNRLLARRSEQRGLELAREQLAHATSELKVLERTRLAVELHDTLAQNLTGISLEVQSVRTRLRTHPKQADAHLALVGKSLESCRRELRNCLRDLRSDALEQSDMTEAVRMTLEPHVGNTRVAIRFNIPRDRLSDNAAHAILRIIRELVLNALRHGQATDVRVAGSIEDGRLLFSVQDNGCGFDPERRPGTREGHFGLQGVYERVNAFDGKLTIASRPGEGTKITVSIQLPQENKNA